MSALIMHLNYDITDLVGQAMIIFDTVKSRLCPDLGTVTPKTSQYFCHNCGTDVCSKVKTLVFSNLVISLFHFGTYKKNSN